MNENNNTPEAKFNSGIAKLQRLDKLKIACHEARAIHDHSSRFTSLQSISFELASRMNEEEREYSNHLITQIRQNMKGKNTIDFHGQTKIVTGNYVELLDELELFFVDLEKKFGLDIPDKEDVASIIGVSE